mmetsp:Transcript_89494/g.261562  ORF Transcript_89494/g.261562 Transcript_89494/m.261562 type:complete len:230 (-) Transcript_89494:1663-2352(-)
MPVRSESLQSRLKACTRRCSSKRRLRRAQSSNAKLEYSGSPLPPSEMSLMPKTSNSCLLTCATSAFTGSSSSSAFFSCPSSFFSSLLFSLPVSCPLTSASSLFASPGGLFSSSPVLLSSPSLASLVSSIFSSFFSSFVSGAVPFFSSWTLAAASACSFAALTAARSAARLWGSLKSMCFMCHTWRSLCHSCHRSRNHSEGWMSSSRVVIFLSRFHLLMCSTQPSGFSQS